MPFAYRLGMRGVSRTAEQMLSGEGGMYASARWHTRGHRMVYTACSPGLALLELAVNQTGGTLLAYYNQLAIDIPDNLIWTPDLADLPAGWDVQGPSPRNVREFGDSWYDRHVSCVMCVPSVVSPPSEGKEDVNYLINPEHADFNQITVVSGPVEIGVDPRIKQ